jgi:hypothetical protein
MTGYKKSIKEINAKKKDKGINTITKIPKEIKLHATNGTPTR